MNKLVKPLFVAVVGTFLSGQAPPAPPPQFPYPTSEKLRAEGYEMMSVVTGLADVAAVLKKGQAIYFCDLKSYSFNVTKEEFLKGEKCIRMI